MKKLLAFFAVVIPIIVVLVVVLASSIVGHTVDIPVESISLDSESGVVNLNSTHKIDYQIHPKQAHNQQVLFSSSNENVATVDQNGIVNFVGFGNVVITVTTVDGHKSESCSFSVETKSAVGINLITNKSEIILNDDNTAILSSTIIPTSALNKEITYSSSDESIASVNKNGVVTAHKTGVVTITASTDNDVSQSISLTVSKQAESLSLEVNDTIDKYITESEFVDLTPKYLPSDTSQKYLKTTYESSDENIASVNANGKVVFNKSGSVVIKATSYQGLTDEITIFYTGGLPSSFTCDFPNPYVYTFDENNLSNNTGKIVLETPDATSNMQASFTSSNTNVVTIDNYGNYTINGGGESTITIIVKTAVIDNGELILKDETKEIEFKVTRDATDIVTLEDILTTKDTYQITASVLPDDASNKTILYSSLNDVATVDEKGLVTFTKPGKAQIKLEVETSLSSIEKIITIVSSFNYPTNATINVDTLLNVNSVSNIIITSSPITASEIVGSFTVEDESILTISDNKVTALNAGETTITYTYKKWDTELEQLVDAKISTKIIVFNSVEAISLIPKDLSLYSDNIYYTAMPTVNLEYEIQPSNASCTKEFICNDTNIASITNDGKVFFKKQGTANFELKCTDLQNSVTTKNITITYTNQSPTSATLNVKSVLWPNESSEISITDILPNNCVNPSYKIKDENNLLNINGNKITAVKAGKTTLSITFNNGLKLLKEITINQPVENIELNCNKTLTANKIVNLTTKIYPQNALNKLVTYTANSDVASVDTNGVVTFNRAGIVTITAKANDNQGAKSTFTIESTYGNVKTLIVDNKIVQGNVLQIDILPSDYEGNINVQILSQTPVGTTSENVITIDKTNKQLFGTWPGQAKLKFNANSYEQIVDIEVLKAEGEIVSFDVNDITLLEGESTKLSISNVKTSFKNKEIEKLFIKHMHVEYILSTTNLTVKGNTLTANCYGIYSVTAKINNLEKTFMVKVLLPIDNINFTNMNNENLATNKWLSLDNNGYILSGVSSFNIGTASVTNHAINKDCSINFDYNTSDNSIATIDNNGNVSFKKIGIIDVIVKQTISNSLGNFTDNKYSKVLTLKYTDKTYSFTTKYNDNILSQDTIQTVEYSLGSTIDLTHSDFVPKNPNYSVKYEIINQTPNVVNGNVLTVTNNVINIVGGGLATIKVSVNNKSYEYQFAVNRKVEQISLGKDIVTYKSTIDLNAKVLPEDATNKLIDYSIDKTDIATINSDGRITFKKAGSICVTATAQDSSKTTSTINITSTFGGITDFSLTQDTITINKGESFSIINDLIVVNPKEVAIPSNFNYSIISTQVNNNQAGQVAKINDSIVTGICGGKIVIQISVLNAFNELKTKTLTVIVKEQVESINLQDPDILDKDESNNYITSINTLTLHAIALPTTANDTSLIWSTTDSNIASVDNGVISFINVGIVTIKVTSKENPSIYKELTFRYTADKVYSCLINTIPSTMNVNETFEVIASNIVPSDLTKYTYTINLINNVTNNGASGDVIVINNNVIKAINGGKATIEVYVSSYKVGEYIINVNCPATDINLHENDIIFEDYDASTRTYQINAEILPQSTSEKLLYSVISGDGISVNENGLVTLTNFTTGQIKIATSTSGINKILNISYKQKVLQNITIKPFVLPKGALIGNEIYYVEVTAKFAETEELLNNQDVIFTNETPQLYDIDKNGKIVALNDYGTAKLTATFRDKSTTYEWIVAPNITKLTFELNETTNNVGIKGERVFGTYSFKDATPTTFPITQQEKDSMLSNVYVVKLSNTTKTFNAPLIWTSSNPSVATVDNFGNVTRLTAGITEITCKPKYQATSSNTDTYKFKFVDAVDIYNINQYEAYLTVGTNLNSKILGTQLPEYSAKKDHLASCLHCDIIYTKEYKPNFDPDPDKAGLFRAFRPISSLYGNGHTIDATNCTKSTFKSGRIFQLFENDVLIDNVTIIGLKYKNNNKPNLSDFNGEPPTLSIRAVGYPQRTLNNVVIANSTLMNGESIIASHSANFKLTGCVLKNSFLSTITLNCFGSTSVKSTVIAKNCVFRNALAGAIDLKVDKENLGEKSANEVTIEGNFYLDNWRSKKEIPSGLSSGDIGGISDLIKLLFNKLEKQEPDMFYNGKINIGITKMQSKKYNDAFGVAHGFNFNNLGTVNCNLPYMRKMSYGERNAIMGDASIDIYATPNNVTTILPGMTEPLRPGAQITSAVYPFIRDTGV